MKTIVRIIIVFASTFAFSQDSLSDVLKYRKSFVSIKESKNNINGNDYIILSNDTLIAKKPILSFDHLKINNKEQRLFLNRYKEFMFYYSTETSKTVYYLIQWRAPVIVYIDKTIPKKIAKNFKTFYSQLNDIPNLTIRFTNNPDEANYLIKTSDKEFEFSETVYSFETEEEKEKFYFNNSNYYYRSDGHNQIYGCILEININNLPENVIESNLKQGFYLSLGRFLINPYFSKEKSLLDTKYVSAETINPFDIDILKLHYSVLYEQKINGTDFDKLVKTVNKN